MVDIKELLEETYNIFKPLQEYRFGLLVYNKSHFKNNIIYITTDINEITDKIKQGWSIYPGKHKFILQAPETVLCDLSEVYSNPTFNPQEILALFWSLKLINIQEFLNETVLNSYFKGFEAIFLQGVSSDLEIRIVGSDKRVHAVPRFLYRKLKQTNLWKVKLKEAKKLIKIRKFNIKTKEIIKTHFKTRSFYNRLIKKYSIFEKANIPNIAIYGFWKGLPKNDVYIFVPKSGLKYAFGFIEETDDDKQIMLWECHLSLDQTKELRIFSKDLKNKKIAVVDRSYSNNTLYYLKEKIIQKAGYPMGIALFPKSKRAIKHSDYFLFLDKFIKNKRFCFRKNWQEDLFIKVINNEIY